MKGYIVTVLALVLASSSAFGYEDEQNFSLTCTGNNFSRYFKISLQDKIKVSWEERSEPEHVGTDSVDERQIRSCIEDSREVNCIVINRITGEFYTERGIPHYGESNFPKRNVFYSNGLTRKTGQCEIGKKRAF